MLATGYYDRAEPAQRARARTSAKSFTTTRKPHPYYDTDVAVVGGKNSAAIAALELCWTGARVTLIHRGEAISRHVKYWIKPNIENRIKNGEIKAYFRLARRARFAAESIVRRTPDGEVDAQERLRLRHDRLSPGYRFPGRARHRSRSRRRSARYTDPETLESDRKGIYLAGVIVAGMHTNEIFIENGRFHGKQIAEAIAASL